MQGTIESVRVMDRSGSEERRPSRAGKWIKAAVWVVGIAGCFVAARQLGLTAYLQGLFLGVLEWIEGLGAWAPVLFIAIYIVGCVVFLPGALITAAAGVLFGVPLGSVYVSIASVTGATLAFLIGRYVARDWVARKIESNSSFQAIDEAVAHEGWKIVLLTRLSPVFPFILLNYAYGVTRVSLRDYVLASWIGMLPGTVLYVYLGSLAGSLAALGAGGGGKKTPQQWALLIVGLIATIVVTLFVTRVARRALSRKTSAGGERGEQA